VSITLLSINSKCGFRPWASTRLYKEQTETQIYSFSLISFIKKKRQAAYGITTLSVCVPPPLQFLSFKENWVVLVNLYMLTRFYRVVTMVYCNLNY